jgi:hypothetical protein
VRLSMLLNPKRSEPLNRMVTLLPGEQWRSRRNPVGKFLDQRWAHGFYVTMTVSGGGSFVFPYVGCHYLPTTNSKQQAKIPISAEPAHTKQPPVKGTVASAHLSVGLHQA